MEPMQSDQNIAAFFVKILAVLALGIALYLAWRAFPYYWTYVGFKEDMEAEVLVLGGNEEYAGALQDAIYRDAQDMHLPIHRDDIQATYNASGTSVAADYTVMADPGIFKLPLHFQPQYPEPKQTFPPAERGILGAIGFLLGLYWFFKGFGIFRKYKVIEDTPLVPIRSIAMGRVQIHGRAVGEKTLLSPVSNQPCFLYKVNIDGAFSGQQGSGRWQPYLRDVGGVGFYLEDETGKVLINPQGCELDLEQNYECEVSGQEIVPLDAPWRSQEPEARPPGYPSPDSELRRYVTRVADGVNSAAFQGTDSLSSLEAGFRQRQRRRGANRSSGLLRDLVSLATFDPAWGERAPGEFRLTEYCVLPGREYDITGTCAMNPKAGNEIDRQLITRGQNDSTFLISSQVEKALEQGLHGLAWRNIVGGGLLAVIGAAVLLEALGFLL
jgi:hypothetical protein